LDDMLAGKISTHIFGFDVWSGPNGAEARPSNRWDDPTRPFREYLVEMWASSVGRSI